MSNFKCEVVRVTIVDHPNADAIEIAQVGDYQSIVRKGQFQTGDLAVYIPEQALVPVWMLKEMGMYDELNGKGGLTGSLGNRVRAIKLRGVVSQGLMLAGNCGDEEFPMSILVSADRSERDGAVVVESTSFAEGDDVAEFLGITKYEPALPSHMRGRIVGVAYEHTHGYDFENLKKMTSLFEDGEDVVITEKIHGTLMCVGVVPASEANEKYYEGRVVLTSKGMGAKGFILDHDDETNLYAQAAKKHNLLNGMLELFGEHADKTGQTVFLFGEVFGKTAGGGVVQDLTYSSEVLDYRAFDICTGNRGKEIYNEWCFFKLACVMMGIQTVPLLYQGPYSKEIVLQHTDGLTTIAPSLAKAHLREGVVVKSAYESRNPRYGRKIAKSVSNAYLLRKNGSEFN